MQKLGTFGETTATLIGKDGAIIGYCLDTPNCLAYVLQNYSTVQKIHGLMGQYSNVEIARLKLRYIDNEEYLKKQVKIN
jgi:hypothetical protein